MFQEPTAGYALKAGLNTAHHTNPDLTIGLKNPQELLITFLADRGFTVAAAWKSTRSASGSLKQNPTTHEMDWQDPGQVSRAAAILATFHQLTAEYPGLDTAVHSFKQQFQQHLKFFENETQQDPMYWAELNISGSLRYFGNLITKMERQMSELRYDTLPKSFIHGNYRLPNIVFQDYQLVRIPDLAHSRREARVLDLAIALADLAPNAYGYVFLESVYTFLNGYDNILPLDSQEIAALPVLMSAQVTDWGFNELHRLTMTTDPRSRRSTTGKFRAQVQRLGWLMENSHFIIEYLSHRNEERRRDLTSQSAATSEFESRLTPWEAT